MIDTLTYQLDGLGCACQAQTLGNVITAESEPIYESWYSAMNPFGRGGAWTCDEWMAWHKALVMRNGLAQANEIFKTAWNKQGAFEYNYNWCKYNDDFINYFRPLGWDPRSALSAVFSTAGNLILDAADVVDNVATAATSTSKTIKWLAPTLLVAVVGGLGYYAYKNYIKGNKQIQIGPTKF